MKTVSLKEAKNTLTALTRLVEGGEQVVITRNGQPVADLVAHRQQGGIDWEAGEDFKRRHGITSFFGSIPDDFDNPLPEDFLLRPLPE